MIYKNFDGNALGQTCTDIVVTADGRPWFITDDWELVQRMLDDVRVGEGRVEAWVRREKGSELYRRVIA